MTVVIADTFTASNGTDINGRTPDTTTGGATWTERVGNWQITGNAAVSNGTNRGHVTIDHGVADLDISVEADPGTSGSSSTAHDAGLVTRWSNADNYWTIAVNATGDVFRIVERNATTDTTRASASVTITPGTLYTITAQLSGASITAQIDGGNQINYGSATLNQTATIHGIYARNGDCRLDDYSADDGVAGGGELIGDASGTSSVTGTLVGIGNLAANVSGSATITADIQGKFYLEGVANGSTTETAAISHTDYIRTTVAGTSSVSGTVTGIGSLSASATGTSTATADIQAEQPIVGTSDGIASASGTLVGSGYLSGEISGLATVTGDIKSVQDISASISGSASVSGTLMGVGYLNGQTQGTSTALMSVGGFILGDTSGQAAVSGTLSASGYLSAAESGSAAVTGTLTEVGGGDLISGEASGTSSVTGHLVGVVSIQAATSGTSQVTGQLHGKINIFGVTSGQTTVGGIISGNAYIQGLSQGTGNQSGSVWARGYLRGTVLGLSTASLFVEGEEEVGEGTPMLSAGVWKKNQPNTILFVLTDAAGVEVTGLGSSFTLELSKAGATFQASAGTKSEVGSGWYKYVSTASEANTSGPIALTVTGVGIVQQSLEYVVEDRVVTAVEFTYTLVSSIGSLPIAGANVNFSVNSNPANSVWSGITDSFGVARDLFGNLPRLSPGTYFIYADKPSFVFDNPDVEIVS